MKTSTLGGYSKAAFIGRTGSKFNKPPGVRSGLSGAVGVQSLLEPQLTTQIVFRQAIFGSYIMHRRRAFGWPSNLAVRMFSKDIPLVNHGGLPSAGKLHQAELLRDFLSRVTISFVGTNMKIPMLGRQTYSRN